MMSISCLNNLHVEHPDVHFGRMLLRHLAGDRGELWNAARYQFQALQCQNHELKQLLLALGCEEFQHWEVLRKLAKAHLERLDENSISRAGESFLSFCELGHDWWCQLNDDTSITQTLTPSEGLDLRAHVAAEVREITAYENLIYFCNDGRTQEVLTLLRAREIEHIELLMKYCDRVEFPQGEVNDGTGDNRLFLAAEASPDASVSFNRINAFQDITCVKRVSLNRLVHECSNVYLGPLSS